ncbi:DNA-binding protein [Mycobacterium sp.]|uniref:DNA-binding protein n=1 Tax=Mycobacterium sp. TaxID=1785 RepID=UPI002B576A2E|nr:DNA-binding protein [Mycobacterium sp.]HTY33745.1 DNA-binding protein [Mycobacterium sp.]
MAQNDLGEVIAEHYGITGADVAEALESLPPIRPHAAALSEADAALFDESDFAEDDRAYARVTIETLGRIARLISTAYSGRRVAELLGVNESRVRQRRADRTLWAIQDRGRWVFPALQFEDEAGRRGQIRGLDELLQVLPADLHPVSVAGFLTTPQPDLRVGGEPVSPLDWLRSGGDVRLVLSVAEAADWAGR